MPCPGDGGAARTVLDKARRVRESGAVPDLSPGHGVPCPYWAFALNSSVSFLMMSPVS